MPRFPMVPLTNLCDVLSGGTPKTNVSEYWNGDVPWAAVRDFNVNSRWFSTTEKKISGKGLDSCSSVLLEPGELIISARGTVGVIAQAKVQTAFNQSNYGLRAKKGIADNDYLYYALVNAKQALIGDTHGGMFDTITRSTLDRLVVPNPSLQDQRRIAKALGYFDEKIALNQEISQTLGNLAQSIFKSWFIDFDPVKAKMRGGKPVGMDEDTAALFPDSFEESELGLIPKGWPIHGLDEISDYLNGLAMQKFSIVDEDSKLPVIKIAQLRAGNTIGADVTSGLLDPRYIVNDGDILFSWSGTLEVETWSGGPGALNQHLFKVTGKSVPNWFSYFSTKYFLPVFRSIASGKATTMGHIQRRHLSESKISVPPQQLLEKVGEIFCPIQELKLIALVSNRTLAEFRDSLLPRLISGELQIPEEMLVS